MTHEPMPAGLEALYAELQRALQAMKPQEPLPWDGMEEEE